MDKFEKLLQKKKKDKPMSDVAKDAKMSVVKDLQQMASDAMRTGLKGGLKKVTVASDSPEGLKAGLEKAEEIVEKKDEMEGDEEETELEEAREDLPMTQASEDDDMEDCTEEELDMKLAKLMEMKKKMQEKKA